jgi:hypothetical protein
MAQTYEIPLSAQAQVLSVTLNNVTYQLTLMWRDTDQGGWFLDIADAQSNPIISGIALVPGANLLAQYGYLGFGFVLFVQTDNDPTAPPTYDNLGQQSHLYAAW